MGLALPALRDFADFTWRRVSRTGAELSAIREPMSIGRSWPSSDSSKDFHLDGSRLLPPS